MNRFTYTILLLMLCAPIWSQTKATTKEANRAKYVLDYHSDVRLGDLSYDAFLDLTSMEQDEVVDIRSISSLKTYIPFIGDIRLTSKGKISKLSISDRLMKYGQQEVQLTAEVSVNRPEPETKSTGYTLAFGPNDIRPEALRQLPIRPDSVKVEISITIEDTDVFDKDIKLRTGTTSTKGFQRKMEIHRNVFMKIEPFGWSAVHSMAPMIDWDQSTTVSHHYFIAKDMNVPLAVVEQREGHVNIGIIELSKMSGKTPRITGSPQIIALPNPVINDVRFEITNVTEGDYTIKIKNILGRVIIDKRIHLISSETIPVNIDDLRKGSYFYILEDDKGSILSTKRLIVLKP